VGDAKKDVNGMQVENQRMSQTIVELQNELEYANKTVASLREEKTN
jgi:cell division septum initiation protein DivIVA